MEKQQQQHPPPLPPKFSTPSANTMQIDPQVVELYQSLMKRDGKKYSYGNAIADAPTMATARSIMIGEIENRSSHLLVVSIYLCFNYPIFCIVTFAVD